MAEHSTTPPHHPTYNVHLSHATISAIVDQVFPGGKLLSCQPLPHGKSFNNRIYFLDVQTSPSPTEKASPPLRLVLKLCGHYFGSTKVQNEVGSLLLLQRFCPTVPTPELIAWSETGKDLSAVREGKVLRLDGSSDVVNAVQNFASEHGWVLQSRLAGRILDLEDLDGRHGPSIIRQLAEHMASWRTKIPSPGLIGSLRFAEDGSPDAFVQREADSVSGGVLSVGGLILTHKYDEHPLHSWVEYYRYQMQDQHDHLVASPELSRLRDSIQSRVADFLPRLAKLPFLSNSSIRFSHMDFSPRNVLVSYDTQGDLRVTGILDFEFAAFLPAPVEFLNSLVNQSDDWPAQHYRAIMTELQKLKPEKTELGGGGGVPNIDVPSIDPPSPACEDPAGCLCSYHALRHLGVLESIIGSIAPWWISSQSHVDKEDELAQECARAADIVLGGIQKLSPFLEEGDAG